MSLIYIICAAALLLALGTRASACTCVAVGKKASATGKVIVGHNEDDPGRCVVARHLVPSGANPAGFGPSFEPYSKSPDRSGNRLGYLWSQVRSIPGQSGADCYLNEKGVFIASDSCRYSRKDGEPDLTGGGIVYALRTILAERATSARHGIALAEELLGRYGYGASGRCYTIADGDEAWLLQVIQGKHYCARRVDDDEVAFIPNHYTIDGVIPGDPRFVLSPGLVDMARSKGWLAGDENGFVFSTTFQDPESLDNPNNTFRHRHGLSAITGKEWTGPSFPFSVKPSRPLDVRDVMKTLRDHYEGTKDDVREENCSSPHCTSVRRICTATTLESLVMQFRDLPELNTLWSATGRPCTSPFVPWYGGVVGMPKDRFVEDWQTALKRHFSLVPSDLDHDSGLAWWTVQDLQSLLDGQYDQEAEKVRSHVAQVERTWLAEDDDVAEKARSIMKEDREKAKLFLTGQTSDKAEQAASMARYLYEKLPRVEVSSDLSSMVKGDKYGEISLSFVHRGRPEEGSLSFGQGMQNRHSWAKPVRGSLSGKNELWSVRFRIREATESAVPCRGDFWLYGSDEDGNSIVGTIMLEVTEKLKG